MQWSGWVLAMVAVGAAIGDDSLPKIEKAMKLVYARGAKKGPDVAEVDRLVARAMDLAIDGKGTPEGLAAYGFVLDHAGALDAEKHAALFTEVMDALVESHLDDDGLADVVLMHLMPAMESPAEEARVGSPKAAAAIALTRAAGEYFAWIERDSTSAPVQAACAWQRIGGEAKAASTVEAAQAVIARLGAMKERFGALAGPMGNWGQRCDELIASLAVIGKPAPEIAGMDLDGVAFKLSDYRGKVVLLDFWGYW
ncbi:MAG: hypothetical protein FJ293_04165 [Planctomycetes bacterium]|nr:hypothetical protein [Planctomycetota bacterium]